jgi:hypothetical protein
VHQAVGSPTVRLSALALVEALEWVETVGKKGLTK